MSLNQVIAGCRGEFRLGEFNLKDATHGNCFQLQNGAELTILTDGKTWAISGRRGDVVRSIALSQEAIEVLVGAFLWRHPQNRSIYSAPLRDLRSEVGEAVKVPQT